MITPSQVKAIGPNDAGLQSLSDAVLEIYIEVAECLVKASVFCDEDCGEKAQTFMAAHLATLGSLRGGVAGAVTQEKVGDISRSYGMMIEDEKELGLTSYGQVVAMLKRTLIITPMCV